MTRALLKQALDALETGLDCARDKAENFHESYKGYYQERHAAVDRDVSDIEVAIEALQAAIDVPETDFGNMPEPEPVAYLHRQYGHLQGAHGLSKAQSDEYQNWQWAPLYTRPAPVKPLTDRQIYDAIASLEADPESFDEIMRDPDWPEITRYVRAIEAAHGIHVPEVRFGNTDKCYCDERGIGDPAASCGDCPTKDYKTDWNES